MLQGKAETLRKNKKAKRTKFKGKIEQKITFIKMETGSQAVRPLTKGINLKD